MSAPSEYFQDVLQVCRNGHVITDLLTTFPERRRGYCDRCGAATLDRCGTCGQSLPGALRVPGLEAMGTVAPPHYCGQCGAAFPWTKVIPPPSGDPLTLLESQLRRLPSVVRQLRSRHGVRPAFVVQDIFDLQDLVRALLPLWFDEIRPETRTPRYAEATRTDFLLPREGIALVVKRADAVTKEPQLAAQREEDAGYYEGRVRALMLLVADPEARLADVAQSEMAWSRPHGELEVRCAIVQ